MDQAKETVVTKAYKLIKYAIPLLELMPKKQKFLLGDRIQRLLSDNLELLLEAYYAPRDEKRKKLQKVNIQLEKTRYFCRLGYDLGYYNSNRYKEFATRINEIGRMVGGWIKTLD